MCGIAGIYNFNTHHQVDRDELQALSDSIAHRGPDDDGRYITGNVGLAHRRLAIIDPDKGQQPMSDTAYGLTVTYNGEIYNYRELRTQLEKGGHTFRTDCDTEVLLKAYLEWGPDCVSRFNGMWSFVILDKSNANTRLFCSRDRMGIKPFYYYSDSKKFVFASELKAFNRMEGYHGTINMSSVWNALVYGPIAEGPTWMQDIYELAPGSNLLIENGQIEHIQYFNLHETFQYQHDAVDIQGLSDLLHDAIRLRLRSDVPLATINSGGIDSSLISAIANHHVDNLHTYSVAPASPDPDKPLPGDESHYAALLADHLNTSHQTVRYNNQDFLDHLEDGIWYNDGLLFHSNSIPLSIMFSQIKMDGTTVVLGGEGADEVFRGYYSNRIMHMLGLTGSLLGGFLLKLKYRNRNYLFDLEDNLERVVPLIRNNTMSPACATALLGYEGEIASDRVALFNKMHELSPANALAYFEQVSYLSGLLQRADRMSMAHGIELRVPFLDHRLVVALNALSASAKSGRWLYREKPLLKSIASSHVPETIINRKKYGFASPLSILREPLQTRIKKIIQTDREMNDRALWIMNALLPRESLNSIRNKKD